MIFIEGVATVVAGVIVFCGSVFLILYLIVGARLAYFLTASITLAFLSLMAVVWWVNPLGPLEHQAPITLGTLALFIAHLIGLSRLEKRAGSGKE